jgi:3-oxoacyl-[acyl-carrier-protein] synthase-3
MEIRQGCTGMLGALELAASYLAASDRVAALITGADNFGQTLVDRWRYAEGVRTNRGSILGDAGTAMAVSRRPGVAQLLAVGSASLPDLEQMYRGDRALFPLARDEGRSLDYGPRITRFAGRWPDEFAEAKQRLADTRTALARRTLDEAQVSVADIARVTHVLAGNPGYLRAVLGPLGIDPARGMLDFGRRVGHLGVNDHIAALDHLLATREVVAGDRILMLGNGVGIGLSCAVLEILPARSSR